ncbi:MAG: hypothetical protein ACRC3H_02960 [Lachnospiraceae bacterium]
MNKREQLIEYITQDIIAFHVDDKQTDIGEAMRLFFTSDTYEKLLDEETGLYLEGSSYVYEIFKDECEHGYIIQNEY